MCLKLSNIKMHQRAKIYRGMSKCVCCSLINLTIGCRIIASIGIMTALWLVIAFANDKFFNNESNYDMSRKTATALGLDWQHFHSNASIKHENDPEGKMILITIIFYSFTFLGVNLLLFVATLRYDWCFALPWLVCESLGCISKFGSLIYHLIKDPYALGSIFFIGSIFNLMVGATVQINHLSMLSVISVWWWLVVLFALISWKHQLHFNLETEMFSMYASNIKGDVTQSTSDESGPEKMHTYTESSAT